MKGRRGARTKCTRLLPIADSRHHCLAGSDVIFGCLVCVTVYWLGRPVTLLEAGEYAKEKLRRRVFVAVPPVSPFADGFFPYVEQVSLLLGRATTSGHSTSVLKVFPLTAPAVAVCRENYVRLLKQQANG